MPDRVNGIEKATELAMRMMYPEQAGAEEPMNTSQLRKGRVAKGRKAFPKNEVMAYLPNNYQVTGEDDEFVYFEGRDDHGWTMDGYVIPRLASGLIWAEEITPETARQPHQGWREDPDVPRFGAEETDV